MFRWFVLIALLSLLPHTRALAEKSAAVTEVDRVIASVDGDPITLSDLHNESRTPLNGAAAKRAEFNLEKELERAIFEKLIAAEAAKRKLVVTDDDITRYLEEVQKQNQLSSAEFETALKKEGLSLDRYRSQLRSEILRSKLASNVAAEGLAVSDSDVDDYIESHPEFASGKDKVKLRQLSVQTDNRSATEAEEKIKLIVSEIDLGKPIDQVAKQYSENRYAAEGGLLGVVALGDLSPELQTLISGLEPGTSSPVIEAPDGYHIFYIEARFGEDDELALRDEVRNILRQLRQMAYVEDFFKNRLIKLHSVERDL